MVPSGSGGDGGKSYLDIAKKKKTRADSDAEAVSYTFSLLRSDFLALFVGSILSTFSGPH
jgi:hypothetical protein